MNQHTMATTISDTRIGCRTHTPMLVLSSPVTIGKTEPPICAKTKTKDSAVDLVSDVNNLDPTDIAWRAVSLKSWLVTDSIARTYSSEERARKESEDADRDGRGDDVGYSNTVCQFSCHPEGNIGTINSQPKHQLNTQTNRQINCPHQPFTIPMRRLRQQESSE